MDILFLVVLIVVMFGMMFWQSKKAKQQQAERQDFRSSLQPGTEVITIGGIIGKVHVRRGDKVAEGALLMELDITRSRSEFNQALQQQGLFLFKDHHAVTAGLLRFIHRFVGIFHTRFCGYCG